MMKLMIRFIYTHVNKYINIYFFNHPRENKLSYMQHFVVSSTLSISFFIGSVKALIHAFIPYLFETSSTDTLRELQDFVDNVHKKKY